MSKYLRAYDPRQSYLSAFDPRKSYLTGVGILGTLAIKRRMRARQISGLGQDEVQTSSSEYGDFGALTPPTPVQTYTDPGTGQNYTFINGVWQMNPQPVSPEVVQAAGGTLMQPGQMTPTSILSPSGAVVGTSYGTTAQGKTVVQTPGGYAAVSSLTGSTPPPAGTPTTSTYTDPQGNVWAFNGSQWVITQQAGSLGSLWAQYSTYILLGGGALVLIMLLKKKKR